MEIFAKRLKELREERGLAKRAFALYLGINEKSYRRYELNTAEPTQEMMVKIADYFGVSMDFLYGRKDY